MKQLSLLVTLSTILLLVSCSNPLNRKYSDKTLEEDAKAIKESKKIDDDDAELLATYIMRAKLTNENIEGMTYADMLKKAKDIKAEQKALADKAAKEETEKRQRLGSAINVALYDIGYQKADYDDYIVYSMAFENKSGKDIKAVKGTLLITDLFDKEIKKINIVFDDGVKANDTYKTSYTTDYNQFMDEDQSLRSKTMKEIKFVWTPEKILFEDGTTLE